MNRALPLLVPLACGSLFAAFACGPAQAPVPVLGAGSASASASAASLPPPTPLPSGLPPALPVPPMGVRGSAHAKVREDASVSCTASRVPAPGKPEDELKKLGSACKLQASSAVFAGTLGDGDGAKDFPFRAKGGHCYRVLSAKDGAVQDLVVVLRDRVGDVAATGPESAVPANGKVCFDADEDTTLQVSVGTGRGAFAVQLWEP